MRKPFNGNYSITQIFGVNPQDYARYNLSGHNGIDYGVPSGTPILAAISGEVKEVADEGNDGYGKYIKIENSKEGCLVAHLQTQNVMVGQYVDEGQIIGISDNTGNSTGPHLHFGYYKFPRNRLNGYSGYIDPLPYLTESDTLPTSQEDQPMTFTDQTKIPLNIKTDLQKYTEVELQQLRAMITAKDSALASPPATPKTPVTPLGRLFQQLADFFG